MWKVSGGKSSILDHAIVEGKRIRFWIMPSTNVPWGGFEAFESTFEGSSRKTSKVPQAFAEEGTQGKKEGKRGTEAQKVP